MANCSQMSRSLYNGSSRKDNSDEVAKRRAALREEIELRQKAARKLQEEKLARALAQKEELLSKHRDAHKRELIRAKAVLDRRSQVLAEAKQKKMAALARVDQAVLRQASNEKCKPQYAFGSSTPRELVYLTHLTKEQKVYDRKLTPTNDHYSVGDIRSPSHLTMALSTAWKSQTAPAAMTRSFYVTRSETRPRPPEKPVKNFMTQSVFVTPKRTKTGIIQEKAGNRKSMSISTKNLLISKNDIVSSTDKNLVQATPSPSRKVVLPPKIKKTENVQGPKAVKRNVEKITTTENVEVKDGKSAVKKVEQPENSNSSIASPQNIGTQVEKFSRNESNVQTSDCPQENDDDRNAVEVENQIREEINESDTKADFGAKCDEELNNIVTTRSEIGTNRTYNQHPCLVSEMEPEHMGNELIASKLDSSRLCSPNKEVTTYSNEEKNVIYTSIDELKDAEDSRKQDFDSIELAKPPTETKVRCSSEEEKRLMEKRIEQQIHLENEKYERELRKAKLASIMSRTRGAMTPMAVVNPTKQNDEKQDSSPDVLKSTERIPSPPDSVTPIKNVLSHTTASVLQKLATTNPKLLSVLQRNGSNTSLADELATADSMLTLPGQPIEPSSPIAHQGSANALHGLTFEPDVNHRPVAMN